MDKTKLTDDKLGYDFSFFAKLESFQNSVSRFGKFLKVSGKILKFFGKKIMLLGYCCNTFLATWSHCSQIAFKVRLWKRCVERRFLFEIDTFKIDLRRLQKG